MKKVVALFLLSVVILSAQAGTTKTTKDLKRVIQIKTTQIKDDDISCGSVYLSCSGTTTTLCVYNPNGPVTLTQWARAVTRTVTEDCRPAPQQ
jgi:hypothetical protein